MKKTKTEYKIYAAWNFDQEAQMYDRKSKEGWQAVRVGCFYQKYIWDDRIEYRYQMDYQRKIDDKRRYIDTYEEQGWEYLNSTLNGWHVFRKQLQEGASQKEYEIYTDQKSKAEMLSRWARIVKILTIILSVAFFLELWELVQHPRFPQAFLTGLYAVIAGTLAIGHRSMKIISEGRQLKHRLGLKIPMVLLILFAVLSIVSLTERPYIAANYSSDGFTVSTERNYEKITSFRIVYSDNYYFSLNMDNTYPLIVQIVAKDGTVVLSNTAMKMDKENTKVKLEKGTYEIRVSFASQDYQNSKIHIVYDLD